MPEYNNQIPVLNLPDGEPVQRLGLGTWGMGEQPGQFEKEVSAVRFALEAGVRLIDTAEMYGEGGAEKVVARAVEGHRDDAFIVSKVYPHNASLKGAVTACERSLKRLGTDYIDMYLLHWRGAVPLAETLDAFMQLKDSGKIRHFGVSNFDVEDMQEWVALDGGQAIATNQILYNLVRRWPEARLLAWCNDHNVPVMAYTPLEPSKPKTSHLLQPIADRHGVTPAQIALAFVLNQPNVITIPKSLHQKRISENIASVDITLNDTDLTELNQAFAPPRADARLELI